MADLSEMDSESSEYQIYDEGIESESLDTENSDLENELESDEHESQSESVSESVSENDTESDSNESESSSEDFDDDSENQSREGHQETPSRSSSVEKLQSFIRMVIYRLAFIRTINNIVQLQAKLRCLKARQLYLLALRDHADRAEAIAEEAEEEPRAGSDLTEFRHAGFSSDSDATETYEDSDSASLPSDAPEGRENEWEFYNSLENSPDPANNPTRPTVDEAREAYLAFNAEHYLPTSNVLEIASEETAVQVVEFEEVDHETNLLTDHHEAGHETDSVEHSTSSSRQELKYMTRYGIFLMLTMFFAVFIKFLDVN